MRILTWPYWPRPPDVGFLRDRLAIGYLRLADVCLNLKFTQHTVNDNLQMQLAHAGDDRLARFLIRIAAEGRIFLRKLSKRNAHFLLTGLRLGLDSHTNNRLWEFHGFKHNRVLRIAQCIARGRIF